MMDKMVCRFKSFIHSTFTPIHSACIGVTLMLCEDSWNRRVLEPSFFLGLECSWDQTATSHESSLNNCRVLLQWGPFYFPQIVVDVRIMLFYLSLTQSEWISVLSQAPSCRTLFSWGKITAKNLISNTVAETLALGREFLAKPLVCNRHGWN